MALFHVAEPPVQARVASVFEESLVVFIAAMVLTAPYVILSNHELTKD